MAWCTAAIIMRLNLCVNVINYFKEHNKEIAYKQQDLMS